MKILTDIEFENAWQRQFDQLTIEPDERVWIKIDAALANKEASGYKRKLFFYELMAAASVCIILGLSYFIYNSNYSVLKRNNKIYAIAKSENNETKPGSILRHDKIENKKNDKPSYRTEFLAKSEIRKYAGYSAGMNTKIKNNNPSKNNFAMSYSLVELKLIKNLGFRPYEKPYFPRYPGLLNSYNYESVVVKNENKKQIWAGINASSGIFDPNISYGSRSNFLTGYSSDQAAFSPNSVSANNSSSLAAPAYYPDISYSYGANVGFEFGKKWLIQAGLNYMYARGSASVKTYFQSLQNNKKYAYQVIGVNTLYSYAPVSVLSIQNNIQLLSNFEFVSIPVTTGYVLYDHKIKWTIDAGISPEILLKSTINDTNEFLSPLDLTPGENSPFKTVYFNGLLATSVDMAFFGNYHFSITPSYNFAINNLTKKDFGFNSRPSYFIMSGELSYIFNN